MGRQTELEVCVRFWRDPDGPEVDWVLTREDKSLPVEVKWSTKPAARDIRHLETFLREQADTHHGLVICRTLRRFRLSKNVVALPWQEIPGVIDEFLR